MIWNQLKTGPYLDRVLVRIQDLVPIPDPVPNSGSGVRIGFRLGTLDVGFR